jgi:eukaryotic-like serine/threonine-protein kinase
MTAGPPPDLTGQILDRRFRVDGLLGRGGMGTVWRVQHVESLQWLALKTIEPDLAANPEAIDRFLREARAAGALSSRHVTRIVDAQTGHVHDGAPLPYLVMELLEGRTLQELLEAHGRIAAGQLVWIAGQLGRALAAAHERGIVHRDLKPSNVFIARDGEQGRGQEGGPSIVKLCDFGIAKLLGDAPALGSEAGLVTRTGAILGTPMYLAPELLRGARDASPATDQWALALVAFRALAGIEYFGHVRGVPALVLAIATERMPPPSELAPHAGFSAAFDAWFLRSCARAPADRFPDVRAQVAALEAALGNPAPEPVALGGANAGAASDRAAGVAPTVAATPPTAAESPAAVRRRSRRRLAFAAGASAWALIAIGWLATRGANGEPPGDPERPRTVEPQAAAPAEPPKPSAAPVMPAKTSGDEVEARAPEAAQPATAPQAPPPAAANAAANAKKARAPRVAPARLLQRGAACRRSAECASGLCAAETCQ